MSASKRNKLQQKSYDKTAAVISKLAAQWRKNKNGMSLKSVTITKEMADSGMIQNGELINGVEVTVK